LRSRILIVDDEKPIRMLLHAVFQKAGFQVETAGNADEAIVLFEGKVFDFVLSDVNMPGPSGHELMRWIAAEHPHTRTAIMSGCHLECEDCPASGSCELLPKPFLPAQAVQFVQRILELPRASGAQRPATLGPEQQLA
jgi:DNA-binding NtrC family response regulator